jgi:glycosyl transferase family 25
VSHSVEPQAFLINLDRSSDRLVEMEKRLAKAAISWQRVPGVDGKALELDSCVDLDERGYEKWHGKSLNINEAGCYLSHLKAIRTFLASDAKYGLILEDDADFPPEFNALLTQLMGASDRWDIVKLSAFHSGTPIRVAKLNPPYDLAVALSRHMNANCVLMNRKAAQILVNKLSPMRLPYDHALERAWLWGLKLRIVTPTPCPPDTGFASTIGISINLNFPLYQRMPCLWFRLRTELLRLIFGIGHVLFKRRS